MEDVANYASLLAGPVAQLTCSTTSPQVTSNFIWNTTGQLLGGSTGTYRYQNVLATDNCATVPDPGTRSFGTWKLPDNDPSCSAALENSMVRNFVITTGTLPIGNFRPAAKVTFSQTNTLVGLATHDTSRESTSSSRGGQCTVTTIAPANGIVPTQARVYGKLTPNGETFDASGAPFGVPGVNFTLADISFPAGATSSTSTFSIGSATAAGLILAAPGDVSRGWALDTEAVFWKCDFHPQGSLTGGLQGMPPSVSPGTVGVQIDAMPSDCSFDVVPDRIGSGGPAPASKRPVNLVSGHKVEPDVDLTIPWSGGDFVIRRGYTSDVNSFANGSNELGGNLVGRGWTLDCFESLLKVDRTARVRAPAIPSDLVYSNANRGVHTRFEIAPSSLTAVDETGAPLGPDGWEWSLAGPGSTNVRVVTSGQYEDPRMYPPPGNSYLAQHEYTYYRMSTPGVGYSDFFELDNRLVTTRSEDGPCWQYRVGNADRIRGQIARKSDIYGNFSSYVYQPTGGSSPNDNDSRLSHILLNGIAQFPLIARDIAWSNCSGSTGATNSRDENQVVVAGDAQIEFFWNSTPFTTPVSGYLGRMVAKRYDLATNRSIEIARTEYLYRYQLSSTQKQNIDLGSDKDLVQVVKMSSVDSEPGSQAPSNRTITQYRYHVTGKNPTGDVRATRGLTGQLKMVIQSEQIEYYAQLIGKSLDEAAQNILITEDIVQLPGVSGLTLTPTDLATKIVGYETNTNSSAYGRVVTQFIQSACGCSGSSQGVREDYSYLAKSDAGGVPIWCSTKIVYSSGTSASGYEPYQAEYNDMTYLDGVPYLTSKAAGEVNASTLEPSRYWVTAYDYDSRHNVIAEYTPEAIESYLPATSSTPAVVSKRASDGKVLEYAYNGENRMIRTGLRRGATGEYSQLTETVYPNSDGTDSRKHLPSSIVRVRAESSVASTAPASDLEETQFAYKFHSPSTRPGLSADAIAAVTTRVERETPSEYGPSASTPAWVESTDLIDTIGHVRWSCLPDKSLIYRQYDPRIGVLTRVVANADQSNPGGDTGAALRSSDYAGVSVAGWGTESSGGEIVTAYAVDLLGRITSETGPGGVRHDFRREMRSDDLRPGPLYFSVVSLPHALASGGFDGLAQVEWFNAAGKSTRTSGFRVNTKTIGASGALTAYSLGVEVEKSAQEHSVSGLVTATKAWPHVDPNGLRSPSPDANITTMAYDSRGRLTSVTSPNGSVTATQYDFLDRPTRIRSGVVGQTLDDVTEFLYDVDWAAGGTGPVSGVGNGKLSVERHFTGSGSPRETRYYHDWRDRLVYTRNPLPPDSAISYDNLDRPVAASLFDGSGVAPVAPSVVSGRLQLSEALYSQRGLAYATRTRIDPSVSNSGTLEATKWFDAKGRVIAIREPDAPWQKFAYDALDRVTVAYSTDGAGGLSYDAAASVTSDHVLVQEETRYSKQGDGSNDPATHLAWFKTVRRAQAIDATMGFGPLNALSAINTFTGYVYDSADRPIAEVDFGTNKPDGWFPGGVAPTPWPPTSLPMPTNLVSVTQIQYDERGRADRVTDTASRVSKTLFDDLDRPVASIENYKSAALTWQSASGLTPGRWKVTTRNAGSDVDRVTSTVYDPSGNVALQVAHRGDVDPSDSTPQKTSFSYDVSIANGSLSRSRDRLSEITYPDGLSVSYRYNVLGELIGQTDQNSTSHTLTRDARGRVTLDSASVSNAAVDPNPSRIAYQFDAAGRLDEVTTYRGSDSQPTTRVGWEFDSLWNVIKSVQQPTTTSSHARTIKYGYETLPSSNRNRINEMVYPFDESIGDTSASRLVYGYGNASGVSDQVSIVNNLSVKNSAAAVPNSLVTYLHSGDGTPTRVQIGSISSGIANIASRDFRTNAGVGTSSTGFPGLDGRARISVHKWKTANEGFEYTNDSYSYSSALPLIAVKTTLANTTDGAGRGVGDAAYEYDGLDRLITYRNGKKDLVTGNVNAAFGSQTFTPDLLGNHTKRTEFESSASSSQVTFSRFYGPTNEFRSEALGPNASEPSQPQREYAANGNLFKKDDGQQIFVHDAWNRLVKITDASGGVLREFEYDGLNRRVAEYSGPRTSNDLKRFYFDENWHAVQESTTGSDYQQFWGLSGSDDSVARRKRSPDGSFSNDEYSLADAQGRTVAVISGTGGSPILARATYDPFGQMMMVNADVNRDGFLTFEDFDDFVAAFETGDPLSDVNMDGFVTFEDFDDFVAMFEGGVPSNPYWYCGYYGTPSDSGDEFLLARMRWYDWRNGSFIERDPAGYVDGMNLYEYCGGDPVNLFDPSGLSNQAIDDSVSQHLEANAAIMSAFRRGEISASQASALLNQRLGATTGQLETARRLSNRYDIKLQASAKGIVNGLSSAVVSTATLGFVDNVQVWNPNAYQGDAYSLAYGFSRVSGELGVGLAVGGIAKGGGSIAKAGVWLFDAAGNTIGAGRGVLNASECGLNWQNGVQIAGGAMGLAGNMAMRPQLKGLWGDASRSSISRTSSGAASAADSQLLKNQLAAKEIAGGHAFDKHVLTRGEYPGWIRTRAQFQSLLEDVINNPTSVRNLQNGRVAYWQDASGTVVIRNPAAADGGTAFQPVSGRTYFEGLK